MQSAQFRKTTRGQINHLDKPDDYSWNRWHHKQCTVYWTYEIKTTGGYVTCKNSRAVCCITFLNLPGVCLFPQDQPAAACCRPLLDVLQTLFLLRSCRQASAPWFGPASGCPSGFLSGYGCCSDGGRVCPFEDWNCGTSSSWRPCCHLLSWSQSCLKNCWPALKLEAGSEDKFLKSTWRKGF